MQGLYYEISFIYHGSGVENRTANYCNIDDAQGYISRLLSYFKSVTNCFVHLCYKEKRLYTIDAESFLNICEAIDEEEQ